MAHLTLSVDFFYRHESDADQTLRDHCQMTAQMADEDAIMREVNSLRSQGYTVQRVTVREVCPACKGSGALYALPKGWRKSKPCPAWKCTRTACQACAGQLGYDVPDLTL